MIQARASRSATSLEATLVLIGLEEHLQSVGAVTYGWLTFSNSL